MPPVPMVDSPTASGPESGEAASTKHSGGPGSSAGPKSVVDSKRRASKRRSAVKQVDKPLVIFEPILEDGSYPGVTLVDTKEGVIETFAKINHYLKPRVKQFTREIYVSFGGHNLSRNGFISLIAITEGNGLTYIYDVIALEDDLWDNGMREFLEIPYNEKVVFNTRDVKDCMMYVYGVTYKGMFDLRIIEIMQRGKVKTHNRLPHEKLVKDGITRTVVSKSLLFTLEEIFIYYLKASDHKAVSYIQTTISERNWRSRKNGVENNCIRWIVEYQKFLIMFWKNFEFGDVQRDKLWWISSELYNAMFFDKMVRTNDLYEVNDYLPKFIVCIGTTDQPLGGVRCTKCLRMMPSSEYTPQMIRNRPTCACTLCVRISAEGIKAPKAVPKKIKKKKKKSKAKKKKKKKVRIEGEEEESSSSSSSSSESDEAEP